MSLILLTDVKTDELSKDDFNDATVVATSDVTREVEATIISEASVLIVDVICDDAFVVDDVSKAIFVDLATVVFPLVTVT